MREADDERVVRLDRPRVARERDAVRRDAGSGQGEVDDELGVGGGCSVWTGEVLMRPGVRRWFKRCRVREREASSRRAGEKRSASSSCGGPAQTSSSLETPDLAPVRSRQGRTTRSYKRSAVAQLLARAVASSSLHRRARARALKAAPLLSTASYDLPPPSSMGSFRTLQRRRIGLLATSAPRRAPF